MLLGMAFAARLLNRKKFTIQMILVQALEAISGELFANILSENGTYCDGLPLEFFVT